MTAETIKTKRIKITNRTVRELPCILAASFTCLLPALVLILTIESSQAGSATWLLSPSTGDWNNGANWMGDTVPNGLADTATFDVSNITDVFLSDNIIVNGIVFNPGASAFTIKTNGKNLDLFGVGIVNKSAALQTIDNSGILDFFNDATVVNLSGGGVTITNTNEINFFDFSSGGDAAFVNLNPGASIDISLLDDAAFGATMGSIAGNGTIFLGSKNLTVGSNNSTTLFSGVISDEGEGGGTGGSLTKVGTGTLTLTGINTYTGATTVNDGSLFVDGSVASAVTLVNPGGLLGGAGFLINTDIGPVVLVNGGIVSPGHPTGTLTVAGTYTQTPGGTLRINVAGLGATEHGLLAVTNTATLAGTLQVIRLNGFQFEPGDQITLLTAGEGVSGTFKPVPLHDFTGTIVESHIVYLSGSVMLKETQGSFADTCSNPNDVAVGAALDSAVNDGCVAGLIKFLDTVPLPELCDDLALIAPVDIASIFNIGVSLANIQTVNLERRMDDIRAGSRGFSASGFTIKGLSPNFSEGLAGPTGPEGKSGPSVMQSTPENRWGVFVTGLGEFTNIGDTSNARGYDLTTGGLTLGVDYRVGSNFGLGLTSGYAHTNAGLANNGNLDVDGGKIGLYATAFGGGLYVDAAVTGGFNSYDTDRTALLGTARSNTDGADFTALLAGGYDWKSGGLSVGPIASFQYTYVSFDGFTESGSLAPLNFNSQNADSTRTSVGLKTSYDWKMGSVLLKPEIRAAWQHEFGDSEYSIVSRFANCADGSFTVNGPQIGRDSLLIGAGAAVLLNDRLSIYAYYDGELARTNYSSNNVSAGLRFTF